MAEMGLVVLRSCCCMRVVVRLHFWVGESRLQVFFWYFFVVESGCDEQGNPS
jgi:hypothetical protein